ncbi:MAG: DegT/DnrJ/EryC1/StrS family aminotransferase [Victivallaceae bacterium]|nr:DegT/DnrJ/EryC1/StrS family aminotransferase [Victivallaceae bacterium]
MNVPLAKPCVGNDEFQAIKPIIDSGWLGMGAVVGQFEDGIKKYIGCRHVQAVNTGTSAIHLALEAVEVKNKEVIVPSMTYAATVQAIIAAGGIPVFVECRKDDLNIDIEDVERKITANTKVILPVHYTGKPVEMDKLQEIADGKGIIIVEDAAHAFGSEHKNNKIGSIGHVTCFSFDPIKTISCGEGGAICTTIDEVADRISSMKNLGISKNTWNRYKSDRPWLYEVIDKGYRYHMSNINAAIGIEQLKKIADFITRRRNIALKYDNSYKSINQISLLKHDFTQTVPFCYTMLIRDNMRNEFMYSMKNAGIGVSILYPPNHLQPYFKDYYTSLPTTENIFDEMVSIPLFTGMTNEQIDYVIENVVAFFK